MTITNLLGKQAPFSRIMDQQGAAVSSDLAQLKRGCIVIQDRGLCVACPQNISQSRFESRSLEA